MRRVMLTFALAASMVSTHTSAEGVQSAGVVVGEGWSLASYETQTFLAIAVTGSGGIGSGSADYMTMTTPLTHVVIDCVAFGSGPIPESAYASGFDPEGNRVSMTVYDASLTYIADFMAVDQTGSGDAPCGAPESVNIVTTGEFVVA